MSDDLSNATIYYFSNFLETNKSEINKVLSNSNGFIKSTLGKRLSLKKIPNLFLRKRLMLNGALILNKPSGISSGVFSRKVKKL